MPFAGGERIARQNSTIDCRGRGSKLVSDSSIAIESSARSSAVAKRWEWRLSSEACCAKSGSEMELVERGGSKSKPLASRASFRRGRAWRDGEIFGAGGVRWTTDYDYCKCLVDYIP